MAAFRGKPTTHSDARGPALRGEESAPRAVFGMGGRIRRVPQRGGFACGRLRGCAVMMTVRQVGLRGKTEARGGSFRSALPEPRTDERHRVDVDRLQYPRLWECRLSPCPGGEENARRHARRVLGCPLVRMCLVPEPGRSLSRLRLRPQVLQPCMRPRSPACCATRSQPMLPSH